MNSEDLTLLVDTVQEMVSLNYSFCMELESTLEQAKTLSESGIEISDEHKSVLLLGRNTLRIKREHLRKLNRVLNKLYTLQEKIMDRKGDLTVEDFIN